jgi:hypothetical protein
MATERQPPDTIILQTNLTGVVAEGWEWVKKGVGWIKEKIKRQ